MGDGYRHSAYRYDSLERGVRDYYPRYREEVPGYCEPRGGSIKSPRDRSFHYHSNYWPRPDYDSEYYSAKRRRQDNGSEDYRSAYRFGEREIRHLPHREYDRDRYYHSQSNVEGSVNWGEGNREQILEGPLKSLKHFGEVFDRMGFLTSAQLAKEYEKYKADFRFKNLSQFFEAHKDETWFVERYHPENFKKSWEERIEMARWCSDEFFNWLKDDKDVVLKNFTLLADCYHLVFENLKKKQNEQGSSSMASSVMDECVDSSESGESEKKGEPGDCVEDDAAMYEKGLLAGDVSGKRYFSGNIDSGEPEGSAGMADDDGVELPREICVATEEGDEKVEGKFFVGDGDGNLDRGAEKEYFRSFEREGMEVSDLKDDVVDNEHGNGNIGEYKLSIDDNNRRGAMPEFISTSSIYCQQFIGLLKFNCGPDAPNSCTIFVKNVPTSLKREELRDIFLKALEEEIRDEGGDGKSELSVVGEAVGERANLSSGLASGVDADIPGEAVSGAVDTTGADGVDRDVFAAEMADGGVDGGDGAKAEVRGDMNVNTDAGVVDVSVDGTRVNFAPVSENGNGDEGQFHIESLVISEANPLKDFSRMAWVTFRSPIYVKGIIRRLNGTKLPNGEELNLGEHHCRSSDRKVRLTPHVWNNSGVCKSFLNLARDLTSQLDLEKGISNNPLLHDFCEPLRHLDLLILYLRRIHWFNFFTGDEYLFFDQFLMKATDIYLRGSALHHSCFEDNWAKSLESSLNERISKGSPHLKWMGEEAIENWEKQFWSNSIIEEEDRSRCSFCPKAFLGNEYVKKHILRYHTEEFKKGQEAVKNEVFLENYLNDPRHLVPSVMSNGIRDSYLIKKDGGSRQRRKRNRERRQKQVRSTRKIVNYVDLDAPKQSNMNVIDYAKTLQVFRQQMDLLKKAANPS